jgi:hypothetical protein
MNTISFKEAIKMVHPDTNPNILDAGEKVRMVMMYKNDESALYKMLNSWGLIGAGPAPKEEPEIKYRRITLYPNMVYNGWAMANVVGLGNCIIQRTTKKRVYFHEETTKRTGRKFCSFNKVRFAVRAEKV